jgi:hypothetical protein
LRGRRGADNESHAAIELAIFFGVFVAYGFRRRDALGMQSGILDAKLNEFPRDTIGAALAKRLVRALGAGGVAVANNRQAEVLMKRSRRILQRG